jgi:hypothetical protein
VGEAPTDGKTYGRQSSAWVATSTGTAMTNGQVLVGQTGAAPTPKSISGDATLSAAGALVVTKANGVAFAASATTDATNAANIASGTLPAARLPNPAVAALGGIKAFAGVPSKWMSAINADGSVTLLQPAVSDLADSAWINYTPTITPVVGAFGSASASGRYKQLGKTVFFTARLAVTTVGTVSTAVDLSMPVPAFAGVGVFIGRESTVSGNLFVARINSGAFRIQGDVTGPGHIPVADGAVLDFSGVYEAA